MTDPTLIDRLRRWTHDPDAPPASDLMDEAATALEELRTLREEDGAAMSILVAEYNKMHALCVDGKHLTGDERQALEHVCETGHVANEKDFASLKSLLGRLS